MTLEQYARQCCCTAQAQSQPPQPQPRRVYPFSTAKLKPIARLGRVAEN